MVDQLKITGRGRFMACIPFLLSPMNNLVISKKTNTLTILLEIRVIIY